MISTRRTGDKILLFNQKARDSSQRQIPQDADTGRATSGDQYFCFYLHSGSQQYDDEIQIRILKPIQSIFNIKYQSANVKSNPKPEYSIFLFLILSIHLTGTRPVPPKRDRS